jgi:hypothetical protein
MNTIFYKIRIKIKQIFMNAKEMIEKLRNLLNVKMAEEEVKEEVTEEVVEKVEEPTTEEVPTEAPERTVEDRVKAIEDEIGGIKNAIDMIWGTLQAIVDEAAKEAEEEVKEERIEEMSKTAPSAEPVQLAKTETKKLSMSEVIVQMRAERKVK